MHAFNRSIPRQSVCFSDKGSGEGSVFLTIIYSEFKLRTCLECKKSTGIYENKVPLQSSLYSMKDLSGHEIRIQ